MKKPDTVQPSGGILACLPTGFRRKPGLEQWPRGSENRRTHRCPFLADICVVARRDRTVGEEGVADREPNCSGPPPASHGRRTESVRNPKELGLAGGRAESLGVERSVDGPAKPGVRRDDGLAYLGSGPARRSPVRRAIVEPCSAALNHLAQRASVGSTEASGKSLRGLMLSVRVSPSTREMVTRIPQASWISFTILEPLLDAQVSPYNLLDTCWTECWA